MIVVTRQIKAARSLLGWEQNTLALQSHVAISTIRRLEGSKSTVRVNSQTISKIVVACEQAGIEFIGYPHPGVQLKMGAQHAAIALHHVLVDDRLLPTMVMTESTESSA